MRQLCKMIGCGLFICCFGMVACSNEPRPIRFGLDLCEHCKMTVVDPQHASKLVTTTGKTFVFDSIECMARFADRDTPQLDNARLLVPDFIQSGVYIGADSAVYLISAAIPSPMGANISAFSDQISARKVLGDHVGSIVGWREARQQAKHALNHGHSHR